MTDLFYCIIEMPTSNIYTVDYASKVDAIDHAWSTYDLEKNITTYVIDDYDNILWKSPNCEKNITNV